MFFHYPVVWTVKWLLMKRFPYLFYESRWYKGTVKFQKFIEVTQKSHEDLKKRYYNDRDIQVYPLRILQIPYNEIKAILID